MGCPATTPLPTWIHNPLWDISKREPGDLKEYESSKETESVLCKNRADRQTHHPAAPEEPARCPNKTMRGGREGGTHVFLIPEDRPNLSHSVLI